MQLTITKGIVKFPNDLTIRKASRQYVSTMTAIAGTAVRKHTPNDTGTMANWLAQATPISSSSGGGYKISMGYVPPLRINRPAPRSTIKQFVNWYRYARLSKKKSKAGHKSWPTAWYYLNQMERSALRSSRYGARFGGPQPPPTYTEAVNAGKVPLPAGTAAYAAAARNKGFIERIREDVKNSHQLAVQETIRVIQA